MYFRVFQDRKIAATSEPYVQNGNYFFPKLEIEIFAEKFKINKYQRAVRKTCWSSIFFKIIYESDIKLYEIRALFVYQHLATL